MYCFAATAVAGHRPTCKGLDVVPLELACCAQVGAVEVAQRHVPAVTHLVDHVEIRKHLQQQQQQQQQWCGNSGSSGSSGAGTAAAAALSELC
jgi:hypothetical protein